MEKINFTLAIYNMSKLIIITTLQQEACVKRYVWGQYKQKIILVNNKVNIIFNNLNFKNKKVVGNNRPFCE